MRRTIVASFLLPLVLSTIGNAAAAAGTDSSLEAHAFTATPACSGSDGYAAAPDGRRTFFLRPDILSRLKGEKDSDPVVAAAYRALITRADKALNSGPYSVVDKTVVPLSGDRHDYLSLAPYWWPDPAKPDGPYIRHDGEVNPARSTNRYDLSRFQAMSSDVETLSLAYYYSGDRKYADRAALLLRAWFIDPTTAMNPNMKYAQAIPGREEGRAEGVLDTSRLQRVVDSIGLLAPSGALTRTDQDTIEQWFSRYIDWMQTSANGRAENGAKNNHGMWFDSQIVQFSLFAHRPDIAKSVVSAFARKRIATQFSPNGRLPAELARTRSLHYTVFALIPAYDVAELGRCVGVDLWAYRDKDGRGLRSATGFLGRYTPKLGNWPYKELRLDPNEVDDLLMRANLAWPDARYSRAGTGSPLLRRYMKAGSGTSDETIR